MPKRRPGRAAPTRSDRATVVICRGGDCGSRWKHPQTDHRAQVQQLQEAARPSGAQILISPCLEACEFSNVIALIPSSGEQQRGAAEHWIGSCNSADLTNDLGRWLTVGGPAAGQRPPVSVDLAAFRPTRASRQELRSITNPST